MVINAKFPYLSVPEVAQALGLTPARVRQLLISKEIHGEKLGVKNWAIEPREVERYKQTVSTADRTGPGRPRKMLWVSFK